MAIEQGTLRGEVSKAIKALSGAELSAGMIPSGILVTQLTRYISEKSGRSFAKVTDKDIAGIIQRGVVIEGEKPPLPLEVLIKEGKQNERGRLRVGFRSISNTLESTPELKARQSLESPASGLQQLLASESQFPGQNLEQLATKTASTEDPLRIGCYVCLPGEWVAANGKPQYQISSDKLSRLETEEFQFRTLEIVTALDELQIPFKWDFLVADTDPNDVFKPWLKNPETIEDDIERFNERVLQLAELSDSISVKRWSQIQQRYSDQYLKDSQRARKLPNIDDDLKARFDPRLEYYRGYFGKTGEVPNRKLLEPLCLDVPRNNIALYAAQGPIIKSEYDCLVIGDRDPQRLGGYHSLLTPDLSIWYPYSGG